MIQAEGWRRFIDPAAQYGVATQGIDTSWSMTSCIGPDFTIGTSSIIVSIGRATT
jgi:hypothetical protein